MMQPYVDRYPPDARNPALEHVLILDNRGRPAGASRAHQHSQLSATSLHPPTDRNAAHWHLQIVPKLSIAAGFELGTRIWINVVKPEDSAASLRERIAEGARPPGDASGARGVAPREPRFSAMRAIETSGGPGERLRRSP